MNQAHLIVALARSSFCSGTPSMESAPPPVLPFNLEAAIRKVRAAEDAWNTRELDYRLIKEYWAHGAERIAVRFAYEWHDCDGQWFRSFGNENWEFDQGGLVRTRHASINDITIDEQDRLFRWAWGARPADHPGLSELGL